MTGMLPLATETTARPAEEVSGYPLILTWSDLLDILTLNTKLLQAAL